jgi:tetratricopeptide (TPR) repeat protein
MKRNLCGWLLLLLSFIFPIELVAEDDVSVAGVLYHQGGMKNFKRAIEIYLQALAVTPDDYEINWRLSRTYREYGEAAKRTNMVDWKNICASYGKEGMKFAQNAITLEPERPEGHYCYGLNAGIYSDGVSILTALREGLKNKTQSSFEKAYALDKMHDQAGPILSMGRFWAVLPWPFRNTKKALRFYREYQETEYFDDNAEAQIYLAELLLRLKGEENRQEATTLLKKASQSDIQYFSEWAQQLLQNMQKRVKQKLP